MILWYSVNNDNPNGVLSCDIDANVYLVKGNVETKVTDKNIKLHFYNDSKSEVTNATCTNTNGYTNKTLQTNYLNQTNQISYCIELYDCCDD